MQKLPIILTLVLMMISSSLFAGSLDYLSNQSAKYIINTASTARTEGADIASYNPAGTALFAPGLYFDISNQTIFKFYSAKETEVLDDEYKQSEPTLFLPNLYIVMSTERFAVYFQAGITGGGGTLKWDKGTVGVPGVSFETSSMYYTLNQGIAYSMFDGNAAVSVGIKYVMARRTIEIEGVYNDTYNANGFTPVIGFDVKPAQEFTFAIRYEMNTKLNFKYKSDGSKARQDLPGVVSIGIDYKITPTTTIAASTNLYLMSAAKIEGLTIGSDKNNVDAGYDAALSFKHRVTEWVDICGTFMYTEQGIKKDYLKDPDSLAAISANPILNSLMFGFGTICMITDDVDLTFGLNWTHYITKKINVDDTPPMRVIYKKDVYTFALGAGVKI